MQKIFGKLNSNSHQKEKYDYYNYNCTQAKDLGNKTKLINLSLFWFANILEFNISLHYFRNNLYSNKIEAISTVLSRYHNTQDLLSVFFSVESKFHHNSHKILNKIFQLFQHVRIVPLYLCE